MTQTTAGTQCFVKNNSKEQGSIAYIMKNKTKEKKSNSKGL